MKSKSNIAAACILILLIIAVFFYTYPLALVVLITASLAFWYGKNVKSFFIIIVCALALGSIFCYTAKTYTEVKTIVKKEPEIKQTLMIPAWFTMGKLDSANGAGRAGAMTGTAAGAILVLVFSGRLGRRHDEGHIHGLKITDSAAKGTSRWAGDKDIAHICEFGPPKPGVFGGGIIIGRLNKRIVRVQTQKGTPPLPGHVMAAAGTGAGKTYSFVIPNVISAAAAGESLVVTDPKGELTCLLAPWLKSQGYDTYVFNLQDPDYSDTWNPVLECRDDEEVTAFATAIILNATSEKAGYFVMKEVQLLKSLIYLLKADFSPEEAHLRSALSLLAWPVEDLNARFATAYKDKRLDTAGIEEWRGAVSSNLDNAISGITSKLGVIRSEKVAKLLSSTSIDMSAVGKKKAVLFCVLPVNAAHMKPVLAAFYYFFFRRLYGLAGACGGRLPNPTRFILDEFANIGVIPGFVEIISTARSLGMQIQFILQGIKQLQDNYGTAEAENILANCPVRLFFGGDDMTTTTYFAKQLGAAAVKTVGESRDVTLPGKGYLEFPRKRETVARRALFEPEELTRLDPMYGVALIRWCLPIYIKKLGWPELPQAKEIKDMQCSHASEVIDKMEHKLCLPEIPSPEKPEKPKMQDRTRAGETQRRPVNVDKSIDDLFKEKKEAEKNKKQD